MTTTPTPPGPSAAGPLRAGKPPVGTGSAPLIAQLVALALICAGVVAVQHLVAVLDITDTPSWVVSALDDADGISGDSVPVLVAGIIVIVLGVVLLPISLRRRPRKGLALTSTTGLHMRPADLVRIVEATLDGTDGVTDVRVRATRRRLRVSATSIAPQGRGAEITASIRTELETVLDALERAPRLTVSIRHDDQ